MTVYVDDVRHRFGRMVMCHMWADTVDELHAEAAALGLRRSWFQEPPKASWQHYDISLTVKAKAIERGAILTDRYGPSWHTANLAGRAKMILAIYEIRLREGRRLDGRIE